MRDFDTFICLYLIFFEQKNIRENLVIFIFLFYYFINNKVSLTTCLIQTLIHVFTAAF